MGYANLQIINYRTFHGNSEKTQKLIIQSLQIIEVLGVTIEDLAERQKEKMAMALLAVGDLKTAAGWKKIKDSNTSNPTRGYKINSVWIATEPDHMIHRNGFRFMGPYGDTIFHERVSGGSEESVESQ